MAIKIKQLLTLSDGALIGLSADGKTRFFKSFWGWAPLVNDDVLLTMKEVEAFAAERVREEQRQKEVARKEEEARAMSEGKLLHLPNTASP
jgi:hypothetical protein